MGTVGERQHGVQARFERKIVVFQAGCCADVERVNSLGGRPIKRLSLINGIVVDFPAGAVVRSLALPNLVRVDDDLRLYLVGEERGPLLNRLWPCRHWRRRPTPPPEQVPWGVQFIAAPEAWERTRGEKVKVAIVDTGIDLRHPDLKENLAGGYNALAPSRDPADDHGHGTHVAGIVAAREEGRGVVGVAPASALYAVKVMDAQGVGYLSDLVEGLGWCVREGISLANLSLGTMEDNETFREAVLAAHAAGVTLVAAAGNSGPREDTVNYPARYGQTIAVSAVDRSGRMPRFASRGAEVDLVAPGVDVFSTWPREAYRSLSGTSMAAPHACGAAALLLSVAPGLAPDQVKSRLTATARGLPPIPYPLVDAGAAVRN